VDEGNCHRGYMHLCPGSNQLGFWLQSGCALQEFTDFRHAGCKYANVQTGPADCRQLGILAQANPGQAQTSFAIKLGPGK
jgi:hypothetical protein